MMKSFHFVLFFSTNLKTNIYHHHFLQYIYNNNNKKKQNFEFNRWCRVFKQWIWYVSGQKSQSIIGPWLDTLFRQKKQTFEREIFDEHFGPIKSSFEHEANNWWRRFNCESIDSKKQQQQQKTMINIRNKVRFQRTYGMKVFVTIGRWWNHFISFCFFSTNLKTNIYHHHFLQYIYNNNNKKKQNWTVFCLFLFFFIYPLKDVNFTVSSSLIRWFQ